MSQSENISPSSATAAFPVASPFACGRLSPLLHTEYFLNPPDRLSNLFKIFLRVTTCVLVAFFVKCSSAWLEPSGCVYIS